MEEEKKPKMFKTISVSAPSKMILHGEHSVVYGKMALAGSLDLRTKMTIRPSEGHVVEVDFPDIQVKRSWPTDEIQSRLLSKRPDGGLDKFDLNSVYFDVIQDFLKDEEEESLSMASLTCFFYLFSVVCPRAIPMGIKVESEIPIGAGLGSSAALSVCLAAGLLHVTKDIDPKSSTSQINQEDINQVAFLSEKILHGSPSGVDNSVSTYGGVIKFENGDLKHMKEVPKLRIMLVDTTISRKTKPLVDKVRHQMMNMPSVITPVLEAMDGISHQSSKLLEDISKDSSQDKYQSLNSLIDYNQKLLETLNVSHPSINLILELARDHGMHGKLTGAGGGGFVFILIPPHIEDTAVKELMGILEGKKFRCWETKLGVDGVIVKQVQ